MEGSHTSASDRWVRRSHLLTRFDQAPGTVIIRAEGGAGKTTLVSQWLEQSPTTRVAWVTFTPHDHNPAVAWRKLLLALRGAAPELFDAVFDDYANQVLGVEDLPGVLLPSLMRAGANLTIVLDDIHLTADSFHEAVLLLCRTSPQTRFVLTTRERTIFETDPSLIASGMRVITSADLTFTLAETTALLGDLDAHGTQLPARIHRATRGHVLATRLAASHLEHQQQLGETPVIASQQLLDVLASTKHSLPAFDTEADEQLALATALCPEMTAELAARLFDDSAGTRQVLQRFEEQGLGRCEYRADHESFRFHTLIQIALAERAATEIAPKTATRIRRIAFQTLEGRADPVAVFELGLEAHLDAQMFSFFARNFSELSLVRSEECIALLERLPRERLMAGWQLALILAILLAETRVSLPPAAGDLVRSAIHKLQRMRVPSGTPDAAIVALARFAAYRIARDYDRASQHVDRFMRELTAFIPRERLRDAPEWSPVLVQGLITRLLGGNVPGALEISELLADDPHLGRQLHTKSHASFMLAMQGEMRQSERAILDIDAVRKRADWGSSILSVGWQLGRALQQANRGEAEAALAALTTSLPKLETLELWPAVLWTRARLRLAAGDAAYGLLEFTSALEYTASYARARWWHERLQVCLTDLTLAAGHPNDARALLQGLSDAPDAQLSRAHLALATGQLKHAAKLVEPLSTATETAPRHRIAALLVLAVVESTDDNHQAAAEYGANAMRLAKLTGNWLPLKMLSTSVSDELSAAVPHELWHQPVPPAFTYVINDVGLTAREILILQRLSSRGPIDDIAAELFISKNTMKTHLRNIYRKLGVSSRAAAVQAAAERGLALTTQP